MVKQSMARLGACSAMLVVLIAGCGTFAPAVADKAGGVGTPIVLRQIVGILARRIVCRAKPGDLVSRGQRFGIMKFGSRIDLFLPPSARVRVAVGDRVVGGETPLATLEP